jgi:protein SCO1/2
MTANERFPQARFSANADFGLWKSLVGVVAAGVVLLAACGGGDRELVGLTRDPAPVVDALAAPDISRDSEPFRFVAPADGVLVVFFGYTSCPDVCPTTLADLQRALDGVAEDAGDDADLIDTVMVTIDPDRDRDVVTEYVQGFVPGAHAVALDDDTELRRLAESFGVSYQVTERANGDIDVVHSDTTLFAVDDSGTLVLTWPFGTKSDDLAGDLRQLLDSGTE